FRSGMPVRSNRDSAVGMSTLSTMSGWSRTDRARLEARAPSRHWARAPGKQGLTILPWPRISHLRLEPRVPLGAEVRFPPDAGSHRVAKPRFQAGARVPDPRGS